MLQAKRMSRMAAGIFATVPSAYRIMGSSLIFIISNLAIDVFNSIGAAL